jgi:pyrroloquinoline quinone biosynthesis protein B
MIRCISFVLLLCASLQTLAQQDHPYVLVLGTAQDGGYPHMGCTKKCCTLAWANDSLKKNVVSLALVDPASKRWWLFEATPDIKQELHLFQTLSGGGYAYLPAGIFITHAHIGHYTGLIELGREVMNTKDGPVYVLPKMKAFLETNGPWSQLVTLHNIDLHTLDTNAAVSLTNNITVDAFTVPHRDEYSETAGFKINTPGKKYLFIPDINKWDKWSKSIIAEVKSADIALLDATFYDSTELPCRNMSEVPHPFVIETMMLFKNETPTVKSKVYFIHMNHTNPLLWDGEHQRQVMKAGYHIARQGSRL